MVDPVEKAADVRLDQKVITPTPQRRAQVSYGVQGADVGSVAITAAAKVLLVDLLQDLGHAHLQHLIRDGGYPQGPHFSIELGDISSEHQLGPIPSSFECRHQSFDVFPQVGLIVPRVLTVYTAGRTLVDQPPAGQ